MAHPLGTRSPHEDSRRRCVRMVARCQRYSAAGDLMPLADDEASERATVARSGPSTERSEGDGPDSHHDGSSPTDATAGCAVIEDFQRFAADR